MNNHEYMQCIAMYHVHRNAYELYRIPNTIEYHTNVQSIHPYKHHPTSHFDSITFPLNVFLPTVVLHCTLHDYLHAPEQIHLAKSTSKLFLLACCPPAEDKLLENMVYQSTSKCARSRPENTEKTQVVILNECLSTSVSSYLQSLKNPNFKCSAHHFFIIITLLVYPSMSFPCPCPFNED